MESIRIGARRAIAKVFRDTFIDDAYQILSGWSTARRWEARGRPVPPPHVIKRRTIRNYCRDHNVRILVETGTYRGDMVYAMRGTFKRIISIELDNGLYARARRRFEPYDNIELLLGSSSDLLPSVLKSLKEPALFWLDGHYSGSGTARGGQDSPIIAELNSILNHPVRDHIVLVDDARQFVGQGGYPTVEELKQLVGELSSGTLVEIADDIIRLSPARGV